VNHLGTVPLPETGVPEEFDTTGMTRDDLVAIQNIVRTQGRQAARNIVHQW
jgi:hypothetical protein